MPCYKTLKSTINFGSYNKLKIRKISEDYFTEHTNITTRLKQKLFTKVIKMPSKKAWAGQTESLTKREVQAL